MLPDKEKIRALLSGLKGKIGVYISAPESGECFQYNSEMPLEAASVIKLMIMLEAFRQREAGMLDFNREVEIQEGDKLPSCGALTYMHTGLKVTVADLITLMIILSDNTATNLLIALLGQENINRTIQKEGFGGCDLQRPLFRPDLAAQGLQNHVSAAAVGAYMERLLTGTLVSQEASAEMLTILKNQRLNGKLPFYLHSRGIRCAHKTGEDDGITHDCGIIFAEKPVVCCFLSNETDVPETETAMQKLAAMLCEFCE